MHRMMRRSTEGPRPTPLLLSCCLLLLLVGHAGEARAQEPREQPAEDRVEWKDSYRRFHVAEYAATGALAVSAVVLGQSIPTTDVRWAQGNGFDDGVRSKLRVASPGGRATADTVSDVLLGASIVYPYLAANVAWGAHDSADAAWQMAMINTQSFALTSTVMGVIKGLAGRARPYTRECEATADPEACMGENYSTSFLSGHTALAFTGAGLTCAHHLNLPLYGGGAPDGLTCAAAVGAASATGALRIAADKHYLSDVMAGAALGTLSGWLLPTLLHYGFGGGEDGSTQVATSAGDEGGAEAGRQDERPASTQAMPGYAQLAPLAGTSHVGIALNGAF